MNERRLIEEQARIDDLIKSAHWLGTDDIQLLKQFGIGAIQDIMPQDVPNIFTSDIDPETNQPEDFPITLVKVFRDPANVYLTCKYILNVDLLPFQCVVLQELWRRKYPMLIASRGASKSFLLAVYTLLVLLFQQGSKVIVAGAGFRQARIIFNYMDTIWRNAPVLQDIAAAGNKKAGPVSHVDEVNFVIGASIAKGIPIGDGCLVGNTQLTYKDGFGVINRYGKHSIVRDMEIWGQSGYENSDEAYYNGQYPVKRITTSKGFEIAGTFNHELKILRDGKIQFCSLEDMRVGDSILIDRTPRWHEGPLSFTDDEAYALGAMIGDGCWTNEYKLCFATKDKFIIDKVQKGVGYQFTQCSDGVHYNLYGQDKVREWVDGWLLNLVGSKDKCLPEPILRADQQSMSACLRGLFDTDGHVFTHIGKGKTVSVGFTNTSKRLVEQIQFILTHYGIISHVSSRNRDEKWNTVYELLITGADVVLFAKLIGFGLARKDDILQAALKNKSRFYSYGDVVPGAKEIILRICKRYRGVTGSNDVSHFKVNRKKNITQRFLKRVLDKFAHILDDEDINKLRVLFNENIYYDTITSITDGGVIDTYDMHVPTTHEYTAAGFCSHNSKIRGLRATHLINDEFSAVNEQIYEQVISNFAAVSGNPVDKVKNKARLMVLESVGLVEAENPDDKFTGNQSVIAGTADYAYLHFCKYWKQYRGIIRAGDDPEKIREIFKDNEVPLKFKSDNYSIIRFPFALLPPDFMDEEHVARSQATVNTAMYEMEFGAVFPEDSTGFYRRTVIDGATCSNQNKISHPSASNIMFDAKLHGSQKLRYVLAVDPASESDNFAIVIIECWPDHRRVVYCWTTTKKLYYKQVEAGLIENPEYDFYGYCTRKIRSLAKIFPVERVVIDAQGGGFAVEENLHSTNHLTEGELPWWQVIDEAKEKPSDGYPGLHIIEMVQFSDAKYTFDANHFLKKDMMDKTLLFPRFNPIAAASAAEIDKIAERSMEDGIETLEGVMQEIEELKNELVSIEHTVTPSGRDRWDTPQIKLHNNKKGRLRKDRYSALLICNMAARTLQQPKIEIEMEQHGLAAVSVAAQGMLDTRIKQKKMYNAPDWYQDDIGGAIVRKR